MSQYLYITHLCCIYRQNVSHNWRRSPRPFHRWAALHGAVYKGQFLVCFLKWGKRTLGVGRAKIQMSNNSLNSLKVWINRLRWRRCNSGSFLLCLYLQNWFFQVPAIFPWGGSVCAERSCSRRILQTADCGEQWEGMTGGLGVCKLIHKYMLAF